MYATEKEKFEDLWSDFVTMVKGSLITYADKHILTTPLANLILSDAKASWNSNYEINGAWLAKLKKTAPLKAELISDILIHDMHFIDVVSRREIPKYWNGVIPLAGACVGCAISLSLGAAKWIQALSTILPPVLLYPAAVSFRNSENMSRKEKSINEYIAQLDKYKNSVISVLE